MRRSPSPRKRPSTTVAAEAEAAVVEAEAAVVEAEAAVVEAEAEAADVAAEAEAAAAGVDVAVVAEAIVGRRIYYELLTSKEAQCLSHLFFS
ncbi:hypothetical protein MUK42_20281 [Musa troglodytarum]|uniref:Uncharacterized protein n=1 Tax=Musa troglodytarum TaxID=320322 RepID=A0A9E7G3A9_9LILI|nr:hypothetical protein MUK42_20281 [Musa troglodytarum]